MSAVIRGLRAMAARRARGLDLAAAARSVAIELPALHAAVLDDIGLWPHSEPELRALQSTLQRGTQ